MCSLNTNRALFQFNWDSVPIHFTVNNFDRAEVYLLLYQGLRWKGFAISRFYCTFIICCVPVWQHCLNIVLVSLRAMWIKTYFVKLDDTLPSMLRSTPLPAWSLITFPYKVSMSKLVATSVPWVMVRKQYLRAFLDVNGFGTCSLSSIVMTKNALDHSWVLSYQYC